MEWNGILLLGLSPSLLGGQTSHGRPKNIPGPGYESTQTESKHSTSPCWANLPDHQKPQFQVVLQTTLQMLGKFTRLPKFCAIELTILIGFRKSTQKFLNRTQPNYSRARILITNNLITWLFLLEYLYIFNERVYFYWNTQHI